MPRSKITWMIIALVVIVLGYLVYKRAFVYKEGAKPVTQKETCNVPDCTKAGDNCSNAIEGSEGSWYKCERSGKITGDKRPCIRSSTKYEKKTPKRKWYVVKMINDKLSKYI